MIRDLLEGFVRDEWIAELDFSSLQRINSSYVSDDLRQRADDVVWRVRWGRRWLYVYLLIEFQSSVEHYMAVRILTYVGLLYQDLIRGNAVPGDERLPPVLPIVLYNGARRWYAPVETAPLIERGPSALAHYRVQARYLLIDEGSYAESELASLRNLAAALFRLENTNGHADVLAVVRALTEWLAAPEQASLRRAFTTWINRVILGRLPGGPAPGVEELQEMETLLDVRIREWEEQATKKGLAAGLEQGRAQGREQGLEQGVRQGEAALLERLLRQRFGELPDDVVMRLGEASSAQLERWGVRLLEADTLDELFADDSR